MRRAVAVIALLACAVGRAEDAPRGPRPLERKVDDADLVVVARLRTVPALVGDEFTADIDEVLKGKAVDGPVLVRAAFPIGTRMPIPAGVPKPPATEGAAAGDKLALFLDAPVDGVRQSRDPIVLRPAETVSSWRLPGLRATWTRETVRALARLDAEEDAGKAVDLWIAGLGDADAPTKANPLLVQCLLQRVAFAGGASTEKAALGDKLVARAVRELSAGRTNILKAIVGWSSSSDRTASYLAVHAARSCVPPKDDAERELIVRFATCGLDGRGAEAVESLRLAFDLDFRPHWEFALQSLLHGRDVHDAVVQEIADAVRDYVAGRPDRELAVVEMLLPFLDDVARAAPSERVLCRVTGQSLQGADAWRAWWKKRAAK